MDTVSNTSKAVLSANINYKPTLITHSSTMKKVMGNDNFH